MRRTKRSAARSAVLAGRKRARRRRRVERRGAARLHWERRRDGRCGGAPQLRHRGVADDERCDEIVSGAAPTERPAIQRMFKGVAGSMTDTRRYDALERGRQRRLEAERGAAA